MVRLISPPRAKMQRVVELVTDMASEPSFYEAQAVVLSNMGQHRQALVIFVSKMRDYAKAEE